MMKLLTYVKTNLHVSYFCVIIFHVPPTYHHRRKGSQTNAILKTTGSFKTFVCNLVNLMGNVKVKCWRINLMKFVA